MQLYACRASPHSLTFAVFLCNSLQIEVREVGGANCVVLQQDASLGSVATIVLRGSTEGFLDDVERAVDDGINAYKVIAKGLHRSDVKPFEMFWK
jgi:chaperonin GroEL (HSP60 family)